MMVKPSIGAGLALGGGRKPWTPAALGAKLIGWYDTDPSGAMTANTLVSGRLTVLTDQSGNGKHANEVAGSGPPCNAEDLLNGAKVARFAEAHTLKVSGIANPKYQFLFARPRVPVHNGYCATAYGAGVVPVLRNTAGYSWGFQVSATNVAQVGAGFADGYFRPLALVDGGTGASACLLRDYDSKSEAQADIGTATDAGSRQADGGDFSFNSPAFPTAYEMRGAVLCNAPLTADEEAKLVAYAKRVWLQRPSASIMEWVGTLSTNDEAQPRPYPPLHDGVSGQTLQGCDWLMNGIWSGTDTTIGSAGDPGATHRGALETICTTQGKTNVIACWFGPPAVETQGDITTIYPAYLNMIRRAHAVQGVGPGSIVHHYICPILHGLIAPYSSVQGDIFNAWAQATAIPLLQGEGIPVSWMDLDRDAALRPGDQHLAWPAGDQTIAQGMHDKLLADGYKSSMYRLLLIGHSHIAGGSNLTPASTAQERPWLAKLLSV